MTSQNKIQESTIPLIHKVLDVQKWVRDDVNFRYEGLSRHGFVVQCTLKGKCSHVSGGHSFELSRGSVVWLDDLEEHACKVRQAPWVFCSIQFLAPSLILPGIDHCTRRVANATVKDFMSLYETWNDEESYPNVRTLRVQAFVNKILADIINTHTIEPYVIDEATRPWWDIEAQVRHRLDTPMKLGDLEDLAGLNRTSLSNLCRKATGTSPMKRLKHLRLNHAANLLMSSTMKIKDIAEQVGYARVHEFSRDFRQTYGIPARTYRAEGRPPESKLQAIRAGD